MFRPRQKAIQIYATLHKAVYHKVVGLSVDNKMERIGMKHLYPIFEVWPSTCLEELRNTMNLHNRWCVGWGSNRAPSEYKLEALLLQLTCSFPLSTYHGYKNTALWNTKYILWTSVWPVILISFNTISCLSRIQHIFIHHSDMVIY